MCNEKFIILGGKIKGKPLKAFLLLRFAEGEGFKPPIPEKGIPDFESSAIDHSANLPLFRPPFA